MSTSASASTSAPASTSSGPAPSHPAFPSLIPSHLRTAPVAPSVPTNPGQVLKLIQTCTSPHAIATVLVPSLAAVASAKKSSDKEREKAMARGEEVLALFNEDLKKLNQDDVQTQSAGLVFVVSARLHPNHVDQPSYDANLLTLAVNLCMYGNADQLHACGPRLGDLAWGMVRLAKHLRSLEVILSALQNLIFRTMPPDCLSGVHAAFLEACLLTRQFQAATNVIHGLQVDFKTVGLAVRRLAYLQMSPTYLDVITYYHHAGLISAATGEWESAVELFSIAVTVPTTAASAIQLAAAKRAILCGILNDGKLIHFPKYIASTVSRLIDRNAKEYVKLAEAFMLGNWSTVRSFIGNKEFKEDCNLGLLDSIVGSIPMHQVLKIKTLYSRMRLSDLAQRLDYAGERGETEVLNLLQYMVERRHIRASVQGEGSSTIISFTEEDTDYTSPSALASLKQANNLSAWLEMELTRSGRELGSNREYLKKQAQILENSGKGQGNKGGDEMDDFLGGGGMGRSGFTGKSKMRGVGSNMDDKGF